MVAIIASRAAVAPWSAPARAPVPQAAARQPPTAASAARRSTAAGIDALHLRITQ
jgi:hypothetical protein